MMISTTRMMAYCRNHFGMYVIVSALLLSSITWTAGDVSVTSTSQLAHVVVDGGENSGRPETLPVPMALTQQQQQAELSSLSPSKEQQPSSENGARRKKRDLSSDLLDAAGSIGVGSSYIKKFNNLVHGVPPNVRDAFLEQDFSNVSEADIRNLNISVLEFIPPKVISKMNITYLNPLVERLLTANRPMALGRVMQAMGDKMDSGQLLDKVKQAGGMSDQNEEAASVLLYTALNQVGEKGGLNQAMIRRLATDGLLNLVPEEQLMRVTDPNAAKQLLNRLYSKAAGGDSNELDDVDDKALIYKLAETGYGKAESWTAETVRQTGSKILAYMPADFLKQLNPDVIASSITTLKETKFENPLQAKSVTDVFLEKNGITNSDDGAKESSGLGNLAGLIGGLGPLAAFINPGLSKEPSILNSIISACDKMNLPAPLKAVTEMIKGKIGGTGRKIEDLSIDDLKDMGVSVIKNGPPQLLSRAMEKRVLSEDDLNDIASSATRSDLQSNGQGGAGLFSSSFVQGIIAQVSQYAIQFFTRGGKISLSGLPGAFFGALGIKGLNDMSNRDLDDAVDRLKNNPDSLDDAQKALLLKKLRDAGMLDSLDLPPEIRNLQPRKKDDGEANYDNILDGLPSDAELRLIHGQGKKITAQMLERDKFLVGTLTPKQVEEIDLEEIPAVLAVVRKSKDGPQAQTLEALSKQFAKYIRSKSEDFESPDKKLLKYITAAEVSKLPATVLAYFIDHRQTGKLPPAVRKEIMIAMGELSTKDHATIPGKTRAEIILQGLDALDALTDGGSSKLDVPELAAIGNGVADLPVDKIDNLTPVALETALQIIQGSADDDDDGLRQRACLTPDQRKAWRNKVVEIYGEPSSWDSVKISSLCCTLGILDEADLHSIVPDALASCRCAADSPPPSHLAELKKALDVNCKHELKEQDVADSQPKRTVEKVKSEMAFDLEDLESQIITRRKRHDHDHHSEHHDATLTCFKVRLTGSAAHFSKEQLESLKESEIGNCIYELGVEPLGLENARVLWKKLLATKPNNQVTAEDVRYAGHVLSGITLNDVSELDLKDPDIVLAFGKPLGLSKNVLEKLAARLEQEMGKGVKDFTTEDLVVTGNILCGFTSDQLTEIDGENFRVALPVLKNIDPSCEKTRIAALAVVTIREQVFGNPSQWTAADVRGTGTIINGLSVPSIQSIPAESFMGITPTVAESLSVEVLAELTPEQIENIPRFSAQALSDEQIEALPEEARDKLKSVVRGPLVSHAASSLRKYHNTNYNYVLSLIALCIPSLIVNKLYQVCNL